MGLYLLVFVVNVRVDEENLMKIIQSLSHHYLLMCKEFILQSVPTNASFIAIFGT